MASSEELRGRARATWAAGDGDSFARLIADVGALVVERAEIEPGVELLDVGTGTGGNVAIPAAQAGAKVTGLDVTPELLELARGHAAEAGVEVEWIEGDAASRPTCRRCSPPPAPRPRSPARPSRSTSRRSRTS